jgi:AcrR family transcriptional regulator
MAHTLGPRQARKLETRRSLLDAALRLLEWHSLNSLGLREVAREAGIAPAAFYRHFDGLDALGVAVVEESFGSLRAMVGALRGQGAASDEVIRQTVDVIAAHVREHRAHFRFLARERYGGVPGVRAAIAAELDAFVQDLSGDLAAQPESAGWSAEDVRVLAELYVNHVVMTAAALLEADPGQPELERRIIGTASAQLRLIALGRRHWLDGERGGGG